jgi:hypothetical protein
VSWLSAIVDNVRQIVKQVSSYFLLIKVYKVLNEINKVILLK